jgi:hypothetical protein
MASRSPRDVALMASLSPRDRSRSPASLSLLATPRSPLATVLRPTGRRLQIYWHGDDVGTNMYCNSIRRDRSKMTPLILDDVRGSDTIRTIKARIEEETGIPSEKQGLICDDCGTSSWPFTTLMKDDRSVASYELTFDNLISVAQHDLIFVNTIAGAVIPLKVFLADSTIGDIKLDIFKKTGIIGNYQRFLFAGELLEDKPYRRSAISQHFN